MNNPIPQQATPVNLEQDSFRPTIKCEPTNEVARLLGLYAVVWQAKERRNILPGYDAAEIDDLVTEMETILGLFDADLSALDRVVYESSRADDQLDSFFRAMNLPFPAKLSGCLLDHVPKEGLIFVICLCGLSMLSSYYVANGEPFASLGSAGTHMIEERIQILVGTKS